MLDIDDEVASRSRSFGKHISVSLTNRCPLACDHCITEAVGLREHDQDIPEEIVADFIQNLPLLAPQVRAISLTGGEPFLMLRHIKGIAEAAERAGISVGAVTSAHWAKTKLRARSTLEKSGPLGSITISHDLYHAKFLDIGVVSNAVAACERSNKKATIRVSIRENPSQAESSHLDRLKSEFGDLVHKQSIVFFGRAQNIENTNSNATALPTLPCLSSGPHISYSGRAFPCCSTITDRVGKGHILESNSSNISEIVKDFKSNAYLSFIRAVGFEPLLKAIPALSEVVNFKNIPLEGQCTLCARIANSNQAMSLIAKHFNSFDGKAQAAVVALDKLKENEVYFQIRADLQSHYQSMT